MADDFGDCLNALAFVGPIIVAMHFNSSLKDVATSASTCGTAALLR